MESRVEILNKIKILEAENNELREKINQLIIMYNKGNIIDKRLVNLNINENIKHFSDTRYPETWNIILDILYISTIKKIFHVNNKVIPTLVLYHDNEIVGKIKKDGVMLLNTSQVFRRLVRNVNNRGVCISFLKEGKIKKYKKSIKNNVQEYTSSCSTVINKKKYRGILIKKEVLLKHFPDCKWWG